MEGWEDARDVIIAPDSLFYQRVEGRLECSVVQCSAVQCSAVQCSAGEGREEDYLCQLRELPVLTPCGHFHPSHQAHSPSAQTNNHTITQQHSSAHSLILKFEISPG
jgi:hypothetical protein